MTDGCELLLTICWPPQGRQGTPSTPRDALGTPRVTNGGPKGAAAGRAGWQGHAAGPPRDAKGTPRGVQGTPRGKTARHREHSAPVTSPTPREGVGWGLLCAPRAVRGLHDSQAASPWWGTQLVVRQWCEVPVRLDVFLFFGTGPRNCGLNVMYWRALNKGQVEDDQMPPFPS